MSSKFFTSHFAQPIPEFFGCRIYIRASLTIPITKGGTQFGREQVFDGFPNFRRIRALGHIEKVMRIHEPRDQLLVIRQTIYDRRYAFDVTLKFGIIEFHVYASLLNEWPIIIR